MTNKEALTNLEGLQKDYQDFHDEVWKDPETYSINAESLNIAIDIMRKYQKIQEIYQWAKERSYIIEADDIMNKLSEVVDDGND